MHNKLLKFTPATKSVASDILTNVEKQNYQGILKDSNFNFKANLIVTYNEKGQQFSVQCFQGNKAGFFTSTHITTLIGKITINAGQYCPTNKFVVNMDYEWVYISYDNKVMVLVRKSLKVPIVY